METREKIAELEIDRLKSQKNETNTRISKLERDKVLLETKLNAVKKQLNSLQTSHDKMQQKDYILVMAQVALVFQENCYKYVFAPREIPKGIRSNVHHYKVKELTENINKSKHLTKKAKIEAKEKWEQLKIVLDWDDEEDVKTLEDMKTLRNSKAGLAHRELKESDVEKAAADFLLETEFSCDSLQKLKNMWLTTEKMMNKYHSVASPASQGTVRQKDAKINELPQPVAGNDGPRKRQLEKEEETVRMAAKRARLEKDQDSLATAMYDKLCE